mmetsp:Transcript_19209/g.44593  ORF Transcript_19209/g.44593 Transcript_19209/m.44593 type:complete len:208 (-) Transcript_19209:874-1497(-)
MAIVSCIPSVDPFALFLSLSWYKRIPLVLGADCRHTGWVARERAACSACEEDVGKNLRVLLESLLSVAPHSKSNPAYKVRRSRRLLEDASKTRAFSERKANADDEGGKNTNGFQAACNRALSYESGVCFIDAEDEGFFCRLFFRRFPMRPSRTPTPPPPFDATILEDDNESPLFPFFSLLWSTSLTFSSTISTFTSTWGSKISSAYP